MTEQETQMQMYIQALPVVLQDWFTEHGRPYYGDAYYGDVRVEHHGSVAAGYIREFIADYTAQAIKQTNNLENYL